SCADFSVVGTTTYSLGAGQSGTFTIRFAPSSAGAKVCLVNTGTLCPPDTCTGTGQTGSPQCGISPVPLDFGTVAVGSSVDKILTISNGGSGTLTGTVTV